MTAEFVTIFYDKALYDRSLEEVVIFVYVQCDVLRICYTDLIILYIVYKNQ